MKRRTACGAMGLALLTTAWPALSGCRPVAPAPGRGDPAAEAHAVAAYERAVSAGQYAGSETCVSCHRPEALQFTITAHGEVFTDHPRTAVEALGCEACHGPAAQHVAVEGKERVPGFLGFDDRDPSPVTLRNRACLQCHQGQDRVQWPGSAHETADLACANCHTLMASVSERAQLKRETALATCAGCHAEKARAQQMSLSRMPMAEGKMGCTNCHNPHGTGNEKLLVEASVNEVCYSCHAEKRGPFLWEHAPVVESCLNCHDPHGGRHEKMLAQPRPRLCQQCHIESRHPSDPQRVTATRFLMGRQCSNCHFNIHGSNHPGGARFVR